jgi:predicted MFS family arabinose efflux permease
MMTHIVIFATDMGYSDMIAASLLSVQGGLNLVGVLATGYLSDRMSRSKVLGLTHFVRTLSFVTIIVFILLGGGSLWTLYAAMMFFGFGWYDLPPQKESSFMLDWKLRKGATDGEKVLHTGADSQQAA